jgi:hypothetical protein
MDDSAVFYRQFIKPIEGRMIRSIWRITRNRRTPKTPCKTRSWRSGSTGVAARAVEECPSGEPHLQSRSRVCDPVWGTLLIPAAGGAHATVPLSSRDQVIVMPDPPATRRAGSPRIRRW